MSECKKPYCDCVERESERLGTDCSKSYPCLAEQADKEWAEKANTFTNDLVKKLRKFTKRKFSIEASHDGVKWIHKGGMEEGDPSRFGPPFDADIALMEAKAYKDRFIKDYKYVRVIIEV